MSSYGEHRDSLEISSTDGDYGLVFFSTTGGPGSGVVPSDFVPTTWPIITGTNAPGDAESFAKWFAEHPQLDSGDPKPTVLGGGKGFEIETLTKGYRLDNESCKPCVGLFFRQSDTNPAYVSKGGQKTRWFVVDRAPHPPVVVGAWASSARVFDKSIERLEAVLDTIDFSTGFPPIPLGSLEAGTTYATSSFLAPMTFIATEGWRAPYPELEEEFELESARGDYGLVFFAGYHLIAPDFDGTNGPSAAWPEDAAPLTAMEFARWFEEHPQLETYEPVSVAASVGNADGYQIETLTKGYSISEEQCDPCAALFTQFSEDRRVYLSAGGQKTRWYFLDVNGWPVVVGAWAESPEVFDESIGEMEAVLEGTRFQLRYYL